MVYMVPLLTYFEIETDVALYMVYMVPLLTHFEIETCSKFVSLLPLLRVL